MRVNISCRKKMENVTMGRRKENTEHNRTGSKNKMVEMTRMEKEIRGEVADE